MAPPRKDNPVGPYVAVNVGGRTDREHRIIAIAARVLGRPLPPSAHVHHFDGNGRNNSHHNLVICEDAAYHKLIERRQRIRSFGGNPNTDAWCTFCCKVRPRSAFWRRRSGPSAGRETPYCKVCRRDRLALRRMGVSTRKDWLTDAF